MDTHNVLRLCVCKFHIIKDSHNECNFPDYENC